MCSSDLQLDRFTVRGFKRNGLGQPNESGQRRLEPSDAAMRNRDAVPEACGPQPFSGKEIVRNSRPGNPAVILEDQTGLLESSFFARTFKVQHDIFLWKDLAQMGHGAMRMKSVRPRL